MRKIILPFLITFFVCYESFSQTGVSCAMAYDITAGSCQNWLGTNNGPNLVPTGTGAPTTCGYGAATRRVVWFKFTATSAEMTPFQIDTRDAAGTTHTNTRLEIAFYSNGGACPTNENSAAAGSGLLSLTCLSTGLGVWSQPSGFTFTVGQVYYLRMYARDITVNFNINVCTTPMTVATVPLNGNCINYPMGALGNGPEFSPLPTAVANDCGFPNQNRRVTWFQFTPTMATNCVSFNITVTDPVGNPIAVNTEIAFYSTGSNNFPADYAGTGAGSGYQSNSTLCTPNGTAVWSPQLPFTYVVNRTYYLRIYTDRNISDASLINICAAPQAPLNDLCTGAKQIDGNGWLDDNACASGASPNGNAPFEPNYVVTNSNNFFCAPVLHNTLWYYFEVKDPTLATTLQVIPQCSNAGTSDQQLQIGLIAATNGNPANCMTTNVFTIPSIIGGNCAQVSSNASKVFTIPAGAYPAGTRIYVGVDGRSGANCSYVTVPGNAIPIPVKMKSFTGWKQINSNQLKWVTATELNNAYFEVERSTDGTNFVAIGRVDGAGNSDEELQYRFDDFNYPALAYYRLKQVDLDGKFKYTEVIMLRRETNKSGLNITFGNPVSNSSRMMISTHRSGLVNMRIVDGAGKTLHTQFVECSPGNTAITKDFSKIPAGHYYLVLMQGEDKLVKPFIKQ